jgi:hypothetical protein
MAGGGLEDVIKPAGPFLVDEAREQKPGTDQLVQENRDRGEVGPVPEVFFRFSHCLSETLYYNGLRVSACSA